jgi:GNAT superfamily N-acetyltransferase
MHPPNEVVIAALQTADRDAAHELLCAFKRESEGKSPTYDELRQDYCDTLRRYIDDYLNRADCTIIGAKTNKALVGIIMGSLWRYFPIYRIEHMGYVPELYVVPELRRMGIGTALLREMEQWFRDRGAKFARIETITAYEHNRTLYEKLGYQAFLIELRRPLD